MAAKTASPRGAADAGAVRAHLYAAWQALTMAKVTVLMDEPLYKRYGALADEVWAAYEAAGGTPGGEGGA